MDSDNDRSGDRPDHLMYVVDVVRRRFAEEIRAELSDHPYTDVRRSELRLLLLIPNTGASLTELAGMAGMTKQSLGEFVEHLQRAGYITATGHPTDRRVRLIRPNDRGRAAKERILAAGRAVERAWRASVGAERFDAMRQVLVELAGQDHAESGTVAILNPAP